MHRQTACLLITSNRFRSDFSGYNNTICITLSLISRQSAHFIFLCKPRYLFMKYGLKSTGVVTGSFMQPKKTHIAYSELRKIMKTIFTPGRIFMLIIVGGSIIFWLLVYWLIYK